MFWFKFSGSRQWPMIDTELETKSMNRILPSRLVNQVKQHECHRQCQHQRHYQQYLRYCLFYNFHKVRRWRPLGRVVDVANFLLKMNSTDRQKDKDNAANMIVRTDNWSKSEPALTRSLIEEVLLLFHIVFRPVGLMYKIFQRWLLR